MIEDEIEPDDLLLWIANQVKEGLFIYSEETGFEIDWTTNDGYTFTTSAPSVQECTIKAIQHYNLIKDKS